ncbi:MAG: hypothetical protein AB1467_04215 [Candidatus Diapherotrites archaeon]
MKSKFLALTIISVLLFSGIVSAYPFWASHEKEFKGKFNEKEDDENDDNEELWQELDENSFLDVNSLEHRFIIQGKFISDIQQIKKAYWKDLHEYLKDNDYKIPLSYFMIPLNDKAKDLKDLVREKIRDQNFDGNFSLQMIRELSEREFLHAIEEKLKDLNISDQNLLDALENIDYNKYFKDKKQWLYNEFRFFGPKFKNKLFLMWLSGNQAERDALVQQLKDYFQALNNLKQERKELVNLVKDFKQKNKVEKLRGMVEERREFKELLNELRKE